MKSKAQSEVITTILLILIVLAAIVVVMVVISYFTSQLSTDKLKCSNVMLTIAKADVATNNIIITRQPGGNDADLKEVKILVDNIARTITSVTAGGTTTACGGTPACDMSLKQLDTKTYTLSAPALVAGQKVKVSPIVGDSKFVCPESTVVDAA